MAKRRPLVIGFSLEEPDPRPAGSLQFADPSCQGFASQVHTFNDPRSGSTNYEGARRSNFGSVSPFGNTYGGSKQYEDHNRKRGAADSEGDYDGDY